MEDDEQLARDLQESLSANSPPLENGNSHGFQPIPYFFSSNLRYYIYLSIDLSMSIYRYIHVYIYIFNCRVQYCWCSIFIYLMIDMMCGLFGWSLCKWGRWRPGIGVVTMHEYFLSARVWDESDIHAA